nr:MAG TPA: hypothetical protein [Caudoviricetes sp.]
MPDITTLFEGTDGATRENFNQKLSDVNAHGNDTTAHITAAEHEALNVAVQYATIGGSAVTKSGTTLQLPAYPTSLPANGGLSADAQRVQTQSHPDHHLRAVWDGTDRFDLDVESPDGSQRFVRVQDSKWAWAAGNTASVAGAMTVSTADPTSFIGAGKFWGVY